MHSRNVIGSAGGPPLYFSLTLILLFWLAVPGSVAAQCIDYRTIPTHPELGTFSLAPDGEISDAVTVGNIAWVARTTYGALVAVDISNPAQPIIMGVEPVTVMDETYDLDVEGSLGFLTYFQWAGATGVRVFDISDPNQPLDIGNIPAPTGRWASYLAAAYPYVYVSFSYDLFGVVDVSTPTAPVLIGQVTIDHPWRITLDGDRAYVASSESGLVVVDISDPTSPALVDTLPTSDIPVEVAVAGGLAYVATKSGLDIINVSDPDNPLFIGQTAPPFMARGVTVDGDIAYVSDRES